MKLTAEEINESQRLDSYLADYLKEFSRSKIQTQIKQGNVLVNSNVVKPSYIVKEGDNIEFNIISKNLEILPENIPLEIVWEDENMCVVNKPSGILSHPTAQETSGTLVNALKYHFGENLSDVNGDFRRGIIHRLDRNTSGLLMIAKNNETHDLLVEMMKNKEFTKKYIAVVKGIIEEDDFIINKPIGRNLKFSQKMCIDENGKESLSIVKVLKRFKDATLVEVQIITGRTHQIRVHMASIGHCVYNDSLYGFGKMKVKTEEQVLQAYKLSFNQPFKNNLIELKIPYDEKINKVINYLENCDG